MYYIIIIDIITELLFGLLESVVLVPQWYGIWENIS
jgi:hypothetical protein